MIKPIDWNDFTVVRNLYNLQRLSYQVEAELIGSENLPPLKESFSEFQTCNETFFGCFEETELAGAISVTAEGESLTICRLVVHPNHFRKGIAQKLLDYIERHSPGASVFHVATGRENIPAITFYQKNGFQPIEDLEVEPGLFIRLFNKVRQ